MTKNSDILNEHTVKPLGSTVADQTEDDGPWTHGLVTDHGDSDHNGRLYKMKILNTGRIVIRNTRHVSAQQYLRDHMSREHDTYICRNDLYRH